MLELETKKKPFMPWWGWVGVGMGALLVLSLVLILWPRPANVPAASVATSTQTSEGGPVTVKATWQGKEAGPVFTIAMDTHSVNLDNLDLGQLAVLKTDQGLEVKPSGWEAASGGHHRQGTLTFPLTTPDNKPVIGPQTHSFTLLIRGVGGIDERVLEWKL